MSVFNADAGNLILETDQFMENKNDRIKEAKNICTPVANRSAATDTEGKESIFYVCVFDIAHTTGFEAVVTDAGKKIDIRTVQDKEYTFRMIGNIGMDIGACTFDAGKSGKNKADQTDSIIYCVIKKGYAYGKDYGFLYLKKSQ